VCIIEPLYLISDSFCISGGGLVIGLSAGLLAPVIGAGLGAAFSTIGIAGTGGFLAGAGGAAVITTGGVLTGSAIAGKGMSRRTRQVQVFDVLPLHNNKRVNCILTVPGYEREFFNAMTLMSCLRQDNDWSPR
jgi:hypothetical protein